MDSLPGGLAEAFEHLPRLRFDEFMELALYAPASGFFATDGSAGRREGDFITSPEVGPLFGAVLAARLDRLWEELDRPEPFTVLEAGAGRGALAISVRAAAPTCAGSLHWVMVERSSTLRASQGDHLPLVAAPEDGGAGPWFSSVGDMPPESFTGAVVANELLDNLPFRLMERRGERWMEVHIEVDPDPGGPTLREVLLDTAMAEGGRLDQLVPGAPDGARVPWQGAAAVWVRRATELVERGSVVVFDYGRGTAEMAGLPQGEWLRTYRSHQRGDDPLEEPGTRDITVDVAFDQLPSPTVVRSQADWLVGNGIEEMVGAARRRWAEQAGAGGLEAIRARSVPLEAEALRDPAGLGGFTVLEWSR